MKNFNLIICGVGGQGNLLLEKILGLSAIRSGYAARAADTFGASQRGGAVLSHFRMGSGVHASLVPMGKSHIVLGLEPVETLRAAVQYLCPQGIVVVNTAPVLPVLVKAGKAAYPSPEIVLRLLSRLTENLINLDATRLTREASGNARSMNITILGVLIGLDVLPLDVDSVKAVIADTSPIHVSGNMAAFEAGWNLGCEKRSALTPAISCWREKRTV